MTPEQLEKLVKKSPFYMATSNDVDWVSKVKMQGKIQKWVDHSISVTINLPETATEDLALKFNITASDADGDALNFTSTISSILFAKAANSSMATVSWTPTNDYVGNNLVTFTVNDSSKISSKTITIVCRN